MEFVPEVGRRVLIGGVAENSSHCSIVTVTRLKGTVRCLFGLFSYDFCLNSGESCWFLVRLSFDFISALYFFENSKLISNVR